MQLYNNTIGGGTGRHTSPIQILLTLYRGPALKRGALHSLPSPLPTPLDTGRVVYPPPLLLVKTSTLFCPGMHPRPPFSPSPSQYGVIAPFAVRRHSTRRGIEDTILLSIRRREFNHVTTFRTRRRNAFSLSHPLGFVPSPWQMPEGRAGAEGRLLPTNTSRAHAIGKNMQRTSPGKIIVDGEASVGGGGRGRRSRGARTKGMRPARGEEAKR